MEKITFIHGADLHLDRPMVGLKELPERLFKRIQNSTFVALKKLVNAAIDNNVDFVILAGDLFDLENRSIRAQARLRNEMNRLNEQGIQVFAVHGNHDHLGSHFGKIEMPENVHIFSKEVEVKTFSKNDVIVHLYGFSYPKRHVKERMIHKYEKKGQGDYHIGILHGNAEGNIEHGNYAPFSIKELLEKEFDYWALGHIHKREVLWKDPYIVYPGNTQGGHRKEKGMKGCYLVQLNEGNTTLQFIPTSDCIWEEVTLDGSSIRSVDDLYLLAEGEKNKYRVEGIGTFLEIHIINVPNEIELPSSEELLYALQDEEQDLDNFVWPTTFTIHTRQSWSKKELMSDSAFYGELFHQFGQDDFFEESLHPLLTHSKGKKYLSFTDEELDELKKEAEQLLMDELLR